MPDVFDSRPRKYQLVLLNNVVEHLVNPKIALNRLKTILTSNSVVYINVPNWQAKYIFEKLAWKMHLISGVEIEDHKNYFTKRELWTLVINSGFGPK